MIEEDGEREREREREREGTHRGVVAVGQFVDAVSSVVDSNNDDLLHTS